MKKVILILLIALATTAYGEKRVLRADPSITKVKRQTKEEIKTRYDIFGKAVNQALNAKGYHRVQGSTTLVAGLDTLSLNTSVLDGKNDVSFQGAATFHGRAWSLNTSNANTYIVYPLSGTKFIIKSSDGADTATVRFQVEGE